MTWKPGKLIRKAIETDPDEGTPPEEYYRNIIGLEYHKLENDEGDTLIYLIEMSHGDIAHHEVMYITKIDLIGTILIDELNIGGGSYTTPTIGFMESLDAWVVLDRQGNRVLKLKAMK